MALVVRIRVAFICPETALALAGIAAIGGLLLSAPAANALTVTIGLQEAGVNGGAITNEGTSGSVSTSYGTFTTNIVGATGQPLPFDLLSATSLNTSSSTAGTLNVWVTVQGLTSPVSIGSFVSQRVHIERFAGLNQLGDGKNFSRFREWIVYRITPGYVDLHHYWHKYPNCYW